MNYSHLFLLMKEAGLSPEQLGQRMGISGMTIRRWKEMPPNDPLAPLYDKALMDAGNQLLSENKITEKSKIAKELSAATWLPFGVAAANMGVSADSLEKFRNDPRGAIETLSQIGSNEVRQSHVDQNTVKINDFKKMGDDWKSRISSLFTVLQSKELHTADKLVAYGAFFYLLNVFDFIPDTIPVFGLMDDFFILGLAAAFYLRRHPGIFTRKHGDEK